MTQTELAERIATDRSYLNRNERGKSVLLIDRVFRLLHRLGVEVMATLPRGLGVRVSREARRP